MTTEILERLFGTNSARVYAYQGPVPEGDIATAVTEMFTQAVGSNLISCVVTIVRGTIIVYTQHLIDINDSKFKLITTLPVVVESEPIVEISLESADTVNQIEEQTNAG